MYRLNIFDRLHLWVFGWCKNGGIYFIECFKHGLKPAVLTGGYDGTIMCLDCFKEMEMRAHKEI